MPCLLDRLPKEILFEIFSYFPPLEISYSFSNVNKHINKVLCDYNLRYSINLRFMSQEMFDSLKNHLRPERVIHLDMSNEESVSPKMQHFLSLFDLKSFRNLRSISVYNVTNEGIDLFVFQLKRLPANHLTRLYLSDIYSGDRFYQLIDLHSKSLRTLSVDQGSILNRNIFPKHLQNLKLYSIDNFYLKTILQRLHRNSLIELYIQFDFNKFSTKQLLFSFQRHSQSLNRLSIKINQISILTLKRLVLALNNLKRLELDCYYSGDLLDGNQWEEFAAGLEKLDFQIGFVRTDHESLCRIINSFRSPFWCEKKHWWVALIGNHICSIPKFSPTTVEIKSEDDFFPVYSTAPLSVFFSKVVHLLFRKFVNGFTRPIDYRFRQAKGVRFWYKTRVIKPDVLSLFLDLHQIEEVEIERLDIDTCILLEQMPNVHSLQFNALDDGLSACFPRIRSIEFSSYSNPVSGETVEQFCRLFPKVEDLLIDIETRIDMYYLINRLQHLVKAHFRTNHVKRSTLLAELFQKTRLTTNNAKVEISGMNVYLKIKKQ
ncbi:unnamed protein product [Adineta ricciae]|uniref:F-box domain-containing protein n=1 Tax=Adineta ricciae TaxID=249248 RepID=A0A815E7W3_ADIRI|nr:unnamed protein product [Adineta ricciae]CAF1311076.1 unnamed protein product [Adineta ricciae]